MCDLVSFPDPLAFESEAENLSRGCRLADGFCELGLSSEVAFSDILILPLGHFDLVLLK